MTEQDIISNKEYIYLCAKAFREDASALMIQLSHQFEFSLSDNGNWPNSVYKTNIYHKGMLTAEWTFYFHGAHCRFYNLKTGQVIEVKYTEKPEFGCLDGFFFYTYMQTTERFKPLADWFADHLNVCKALEILVEEGMLTKHPGIGSGNCVIAI